jgi:transposase
MHLDCSATTINGKTYTKALLRESYREGGKVKKRTIASLGNCTQEEIEAIRLALLHKQELKQIIESRNSAITAWDIKQGPSFGAVYVLSVMAKRLGITEALGNSREGKLALWQIFARVINQGSRLSAVRLAASHTACDVLGLDSFNEEDLYANLNWLNENQAGIEERLFKKNESTSRKSGLFLYDVTSSYFEGTQNELAAFGYNRDKKRGKLQIVIGLLCNEKGNPLAIEVFHGNTSDPQTVENQIKKIAARFGGGVVTLVGDRGMIKNPQKTELLSKDSHYITAITKPQIEKLLKTGIFQMGLFDVNLSEVITEESIRYILKKNPVRMAEIRNTRESKLNVLNKELEKQNEYLKLHQRSRIEVALKKLSTKAGKLRIQAWIQWEVNQEDRMIGLKVDQAVLDEESRLDGCYVIETDLGQEHGDKELIHSRYKDLSKVERAFRSSKTVDLEMRPIYLRLEERTRAHAFVVMLAYRILKELETLWTNIELTPMEAIQELDTLCVQDVSPRGKPVATSVYQVPTPRASIENLLLAAKITLPAVLKKRGVIVDTRKKLTSERKSA